MYGGYSRGGGIRQITPAPTVFDAYANTVSTLDKLRQQGMLNALTKIKLNVAPTLAQQSVQQGAAQTSILQNQANFAPMLSALNVQQRQILNAMNSQKFQEQPQAFKQAMALKAAQIEQIKQNIQLAPQKLALQQGRFGAVYQLQKILSTMTPAARAAYIAANPDVMNEIYMGAMNKAVGNAPGQPTSPPPQTAPTSMPVNPGAAGQPIAPSALPPDIAAPGANASMPQTAPPVMQQVGQPQPSPIAAATPSAAPQNATPNSAQPPKFVLASEIAANKGSVSPQAYRRGESSAELESLFQDPIQQRMVKNASYYVGPQGQLRAAYDAIHAPNSQRYNDYLTFHNQLPTQLANVTRFMDGMGVQLQTRNELLGNYTDAFNRNFLGTPEQALKQWDNMLDVVRNTSRNSLKLAQPAFPGTIEKVMGINLKDPPPYLSQSNKENATVRLTDGKGNEFEVPESRVADAIKNYNLKRVG